MNHSPRRRVQTGLGAVFCALALLASSGTARGAAAAAAPMQIPVEYFKLPNGLKVVLSRDTTAPVAVVAVYFNIGFRIEPKDRTGFAHLFEHMMFQGSENLGKMEFIKLVQSNGGVLNGSTRFDFTNYFEVVPAHTLETALWAEADRMKGLAITADNLKNQQEVVKNEVKVNVLNQPYGGFPWLDLPQYANTNWYNSHNFYGDLKDLDAATLEDVSSFFKTFYAPGNAVLVIVGDFDPAQAKTWVEKYFAPIPSAALPAKADISEPRQEKEKRATKEDKLATRPAISVRRCLALITKPFRQAAREPRAAVEIVFVVTPLLAGQQHVPGVMIVVVPLSTIVAARGVFRRVEEARAVVVIFQNQMNMSAGLPCVVADGPAQLVENVRLPRSEDRVHGVEPQSVKAIVPHPH